MISRRRLLLGAATLATVPAGCIRPRRTGTSVNDIHSRLNPTRVDRVVAPASVDALQETIRRAAIEGRTLSIAGGRHAMGGQQFGAGTDLIDTTAMKRVLGFDRTRGLVEVEAGIQWPELIAYLVRAQAGAATSWGIVQKQTGADRLCLGGALAANVHGRGLRFKPIVADVEAFTLVDATGELRTCSRTENAELFRLAIGGYGLFGCIASVTLRLAPRRRLERVVEIIDVADLLPALERRIADGFLYGDCQYATDAASPDFLRRGVFSCYRPVDERGPLPAAKELSLDDWNRLVYLSHTDKRRAFELYGAYYLSTNGQRYWSDTHQLSVYVDDYHTSLDQRLGTREPATEVISEVYVRRPALSRFLAEVRKDFRAHDVDVIYGTIRLIEKDDETFLPWAREAYACVIVNLHAVHSRAGIARARRAFRRLIDLALDHGGSYFLTYHRFAERRQVEAAYPRFVEFLREKRRHDPGERFQSEWYRHYRSMFADVL
jgi:FAD/FMN-containing dehydrogenase